MSNKKRPIRTEHTAFAEEKLLTSSLDNLNLNRQSMLEHQLTDVTRKLKLILSFNLHFNILEEAKQRNNELTATYRRCYDDLNKDERFGTTRQIYERLFLELEEANIKMTRIQSELTQEINFPENQTQLQEAKIAIEKELSGL